MRNERDCHTLAGPTSEMDWLPRNWQCKGRSESEGTDSLASTTSSWCCTRRVINPSSSPDSSVKTTDGSASKGRIQFSW